ncbi:hypothetical protein AGMMS50212_16050 [Spirochaetia bacterium]|nr:hypothetical protein AGMMS50212_16050 [Spirochaetia bacterium]
MLPAIEDGRVLIVNRLSYGFKPPASQGYFLRWAAPKEGDVVVFWTPFGDLAVKRCTERLEDGRFMAVGDNQVESFDSRSYGPVAEDSIVGKVMGIR